MATVSLEPKMVSLEAVHAQPSPSKSSTKLGSSQGQESAGNSGPSMSPLKIGGAGAAAAARVLSKVTKDGAQAGFVEVRRYVEENHCSVKALTFCIAASLFFFSVLSVLNIFKAVFQPFHYLFAFYNVIFSAIIIVAEGNAPWFLTCGDLQPKLFSAAAFMASQSGRAMFYFYVGSINLFMLPDDAFWQLVYIGLGLSLCFAGVIMLLDSWGRCRGQQTQHEVLHDEEQPVAGDRDEGLNIADLAKEQPIDLFCVRNSQASMQRLVCRDGMRTAILLSVIASAAP
eukprot:CAMPEP_0178415252 /NCGR_PEP_ID=MMETSP0689_2-20121128/23457_1 /TAXON_ID=160604 /ORGANISM="Amphidinium massartii, Strain CS-259" /LENGTH=284 /DNA_ID=CAMNT_0020036569 /DNA_START=72 /DNA_END=927 /DNA_ORIENTATION=+